VVEAAVVEATVVETALVEAGLVEIGLVEVRLAEAGLVEAAATGAAEVATATTVLRLAGPGRHEDCCPGKEQQAAEQECFPKHGVPPLLMLGVRDHIATGMPGDRPLCEWHPDSIKVRSFRRLARDAIRTA
jgi:hypothetical protein